MLTRIGPTAARIGVCAALLAAVAAAAVPTEWQTSAPPPYPGEMNLAQSDYVEHCGGCHGIQGDASPAQLPSLRGRVGWFMCNPEARSYLLRLPNVARSRITDNVELADLLNFMVFGLGGASTPKNAKPFTGAEVGRERLSPFTSVSLVKTRAAVVDGLIKRCGAPASLRLMYPGQPH
ncbi:MAG: cytochrome C [Sandarakinorhabdus sp.]|nr:cytochrome C [Sandarakinorhabdus sp.]